MSSGNVSAQLIVILNVIDYQSVRMDKFDGGCRLENLLIRCAHAARREQRQGGPNSFSAASGKYRIANNLRNMWGRFPLRQCV